MTRSTIWRGFPAAALVAAAFFSGACGSERVVAPSDAKLSVRAVPASGAVGEPIEIVALLTAGTKPVRRGTIVEFSVTPTTAATISPREAETDANGEARATLTGSEARSVTVAVASGSAEPKTLPVTITEPGSLEITVQASRGTMSVDGDTAEITARIVGAPAGAEVNFSVHGVQGGFVDPVRVPIQNGSASTVFRSDRSNYGTTTILAQGPGFTQEDVDIELVNVVKRVDLSADKTTLVAADHPNGVEITFTAEPIGLARDARLTGVTVAFSTTVGTFTTTASPETDANGKATAKLSLTKANLDAAKAGSAVTVSVSAVTAFGSEKTNSLTLVVN